MAQGDLQPDTIMFSFRSLSVLAHGHLLVLVVILTGTGIDHWRSLPSGPSPQGCIVPPDLPEIPDAEVAALGGIVDYAVSNSGFMYVINGVDQPSLTVVRGQSYDFSISVQSVHPFFIQTSLAGPEYEGFNGQGATSGTFTLTIPIDEPLEQLVYICGIHGQSMSNTIEIADPPAVLVSPIVMLEGPYDGSALMNDDLRSDGLIPLSEPYSALGYGFTGTNDGSTMQSVLDTEGDDAIVDWVIVELRDGTAPESVIGSRSALLQRDGDVVDTDGTSPVSFDGIADGEYHVAVRHRNHLAVMTAGPVALSSTNTTIDLTDAGTATFGTDALKDDGGTMLLWAGDVNFDGELKYTGADNDRDPILQEIGGTVPTNSTVGYDGTDANMDGLNRYTGGGNDRDPILQNIGGVIPTNTRQEQLP